MSEHDGEWATPKRLPFLNNSLLRSLTSTTNTIVAHHIALIVCFFNIFFCVDDASSVLSIDDWGDVNLGLDKTERPSVVQSLGEQVDRATDSKAGKVSGKADGLYMCIFVESRCGQAQERMQITQSVI